MEEKGPLPPGWDMKFDSRTNKHYFINHYTKTTSWEDPRDRYQQIGKPTAKDKENHKPDGSEGRSADHSTVPTGYAMCSIPPSSVAPLTNLQVASIQRELDAENPNSNWLEYRQARASSPGGGPGGRATPLMGTNSSLNQYHHHGATASPQLLTRLQLEEAGDTFQSPQSQRSTLRRDSHILAEISEMESSFSNQEQALARIAAMFPTVEESHIRELFKKYHGSQAVVISALQVAKHPIATMGPSSVYTPPAFRHATLPGVANTVLANLTMTGSLPYNFHPNMTPTMGIRDISSMDQSSGYPSPRPGTAASDLDTTYYMGSPQISGTLFRSFPKPHSSPKMKLRYLKSVFPTVEEYLLLDVLANSENNVQKAADRLVKMGYVKRDAPSAPRLHAKKKEEERLAEKRTPLPKPPPIKTDQEKEGLRNKMKEKYEKKFDIPERILFMALESVLYDEDQANNLITAMIEDDLKRKKQKEMEKAREKAEKKKSPRPTRKMPEVERPPKSPKHAPKKEVVVGGHGKKGFPKTVREAKEAMPRISRGTSTAGEEEPHPQLKPGCLARGPNPNLRKGPNDDLLLTDYVIWNGPDPNLRKGPNTSLAQGPQAITAVGPNPSNRRGPQDNARGPNPSLRKGPQVSLAKGSIKIDTQDVVRSC